MRVYGNANCLKLTAIVLSLVRFDRSGYWAVSSACHVKAGTAQPCGLPCDDAN